MFSFIYNSNETKLSSKGFSLVEVMIALTIVVGAIFVLSSSWSGHYLKVRKVHSYDTVAYLLEKKMIEIENLFDGSLDSISDEAQGDFGKEYKNYRWSIKSQKIELPSLSELYKSQEGEVDSNLITLLGEFRDRLNESIKEVRVTVEVTSGKNKAEYSLTNYFISFDGKNGI